MLLFDTLRADRLGTYGHDGGLTPNIDKIAHEGVIFENCNSVAPWTLPSVASLFSSVYPAAHKATSFRVVEDMKQGRKAKVRIFDANDQLETIPELVKRLGYATCGVSANAFVQSEYGFGEGFDDWYGEFADNTVPGRLVNDAAIKWLHQRNTESEPVFLYLHYMDVHGPYNAEPRFLNPLLEEFEADRGRKLRTEEFNGINSYIRKPPKVDPHPEQYEDWSQYLNYWIARYDAGVRELDYYVGELRHELDRLGVWENALVLLLSDHGEALCEHTYWEHGFSQYQTDLHVPLILRYPSKVQAGRRVQARVQLLDVLPTIAEFLDQQPPDNAQGRSLIPLIMDGIEDGTRLTFAEALKKQQGRLQQVAVFRDQWKLMQRMDPDASDDVLSEPAQLFNLESDPGEENDRANDNPDMVRDLLEAMHTIRRLSEELGSSIEEVERESTEEQTDRLKALGYAGYDDAE